MINLEFFPSFSIMLNTNHPKHLETAFQRVRWFWLWLVSWFFWPSAVRNAVEPHVLQSSRQLTNDIQGWSDDQLDRLGQILRVRKFRARISGGLATQVRYAKRMADCTFHAYLLEDLHGWRAVARPARRCLRINQAELVAAIDVVLQETRQRNIAQAEKVRQADAWRRIDAEERQQGVARAHPAKTELRRIRDDAKSAQATFASHATRANAAIDAARRRVQSYTELAQQFLPAAAKIEKQRAEAERCLSEKLRAHERLCRLPAYPPTPEMRAELKQAYRRIDMQHASALVEYQRQWDASEGQRKQLETIAHEVSSDLRSFEGAREAAAGALARLVACAERLILLDRQARNQDGLQQARERLSRALVAASLDDKLGDSLLQAGLWHLTPAEQPGDRQHLLREVQQESTGVQCTRIQLEAEFSKLASIDTANLDPRRIDEQAR